MPTATPQPLRASDGRTLSAWRFAPDTTPRASVILMGAYAVRQRYYRRFAMWLAHRGFQVLTFDTRGIGESRDGHVRDEPVDTTGWAVLDHGAALEWLGGQEGPRLAVAHSFGGQVLGIHDGASVLDGIYMVGSQMGYWGHYDGLSRPAMRVLVHLVLPGVAKGFGYVPGWTGMGEDVPPQVALEWAKWLRSPGYLLDHVPGAAERMRAFGGEVQAVGFTDDAYAPPRGVRALTDALDPARTHVRILSPADVRLRSVGHFGFFRPHRGEVLWEDALGHLERWARPAREARSA